MVFHQPDNSRGNYNYNGVIYKNTVWQPHFHKNLEVVYCIEGRVECSVNGTFKTLEKQEFALFLSNEIHSMTPIGETVYWVGVFSEDHVNSFARSVFGKTGDTFIFKCSETVEKLICENLIYKTNAADKYIMKACFYALCSEYLKSVTLIDRAQKSDLLMRSMTEYIANNFKENISLKSMADRIGYNYHYLSKVFRRIFEMSFPTFLNAYRADHAIGLLIEADMDVAEIAFESGFQSVRNFNEFFKKYTGMTPNEFRKNK